MKIIELKKFLDSLTPEELECDIAATYHGINDDGEGYAGCDDVVEIRWDMDYKGNKFLDLRLDGVFDED